MIKGKVSVPVYAICLMVDYLSFFCFQTVLDREGRAPTQLCEESKENEWQTTKTLLLEAKNKEVSFCLVFSYHKLDI